MGFKRKTASQSMAMAYKSQSGGNRYNQKANTWTHKKAGEYKAKMAVTFGDPDVEGDDICIWNDGEGKSTKTFIKDEGIAHAFPMDHTDFVYSVMPVPEWAPKDGVSTVAPETVEALAKVSGSIIIDGLKGEVTARCGMMIKNGVTLGFVEDFVAGKVKGDPKEEYSRRIKANEIPKWWLDLMRERHMV